MAKIKHYLQQPEDLLPQIETTTCLKRMTEARTNGDTVLFKKFEPNPAIKDRVKVMRNLQTGQYFEMPEFIDWYFKPTDNPKIFKRTSTLRQWIDADENWDLSASPSLNGLPKSEVPEEPVELYELILDWTSYYPHKTNKPYAAYIVPKELTPGTKVKIPKVIEDIVAVIDTGSTRRLWGPIATWTGTDLVIDIDSLKIRNNKTGKYEYPEASKTTTDTSPNEHLYAIKRMMFIGSGFGFEDLDLDTNIEILNNVQNYINNILKG